LAFYKSTQPLWETKYRRNFSRAINNPYFDKEIEVEIVPAVIFEPPPPPPKPKPPDQPTTTPKSSKKPKSSTKRTAKMAFEAKSERAQMKETAEIRSIYPPGAILMAAGQSLRIDDRNDAAYMLKHMVADPEIATKSRKAMKLENPCKFLLYVNSVKLTLADKFKGHGVKHSGFSSHSDFT